MPEPASPDALFSPLVEHAAELAAQWHDGTYRKGRWRAPPFALEKGGDRVQVPVIAHLTAVATIVQRAGWGEATVAAAYLHDSLEDRNRAGDRLGRAQLEDAMGAEVTRLVAQVSETKQAPDGTERPWRARKEGYIEQVEQAGPRAAAISLADKLHNVWTMNQALAQGTDIFADGPHRTALSAGPDAQVWFYRAVRDATTCHDDPRLPPMRTRLNAELDRFEALVD